MKLNYINNLLLNYINNLFIHVSLNVFKNIWEMICLQQFYNIFTINPKWQVVKGCYCWVKKVISVLNSNLNK